MSAHRSGPSRVGLAATAVVLVGCGSSGPPSFGEAPIDVTSAAMAGTASGEVTVRGFLITDEAGVRFCEYGTDSLPPQCAGATIAVTMNGDGFDSPPDGVVWAENAELTGRLVDRVLEVRDVPSIAWLAVP